MGLTIRMGRFPGPLWLKASFNHEHYGNARVGHPYRRRHHHDDPQTARPTGILSLQVSRLEDPEPQAQKHRPETARQIISDKRNPEKLPTAAHLNPAAYNYALC